MSTVDIKLDNLSRAGVLVAIDAAMDGCAKDITIERGLAALPTTGAGVTEVFGWNMKVTDISVATANRLDNIAQASAHG